MINNLTTTQMEEKEQEQEQKTIFEYRHIKDDDEYELKEGETVLTDTSFHRASYSNYVEENKFDDGINWVTGYLNHGVGDTNNYYQLLNERTRCFTNMNSQTHRGNLRVLSDHHLYSFDINILNQYSEKIMTWNILHHYGMNSYLNLEAHDIFKDERRRYDIIINILLDWVQQCDMFALQECEEYIYLKLKEELSSSHTILFIKSKSNIADTWGEVLILSNRYEIVSDVNSFGFYKQSTDDYRSRGVSVLVKDTYENKLKYIISAHMKTIKSDEDQNYFVQDIKEVFNRRLLNTLTNEEFILKSKTIDIYFIGDLNNNRFKLETTFKENFNYRMDRVAQPEIYLNTHLDGLILFKK